MVTGIVTQFTEKGKVSHAYETACGHPAGGAVRPHAPRRPCGRVHQQPRPRRPAPPALLRQHAGSKPRKILQRRAPHRPGGQREGWGARAGRPRARLADRLDAKDLPAEHRRSRARQCHAPVPKCRTHHHLSAAVEFFRQRERRIQPHLFSHGLFGQLVASVGHAGQRHLFVLSCARAREPLSGGWGQRAPAGPTSPTPTKTTG